MIDRDATIAKFRYDSDTLSRGSYKKVVAVCEGCGEVRDIQKRSYGDLCMSCACSRYWKDPKAREKQSATRKKYFEDPEARKKSGVSQRKRYENPKERENTSAAIKKHYEDPKAREKMSVVSKKRWEDPEAREKQSATRKKHFEDPKASEKLSVAKKKYFEDHPEAHKKMSVAQKKYAKDNPISGETRKKMSATQQGIDYEDWVEFAKDKPYCPAFNETCRESNREKYGRRCFICGKHESKNITRAGKQKKLSVHHVDMNKDQGCNGHEWKLIPTCLRHHGTTHTSLWISRITYLLRNIDYNHH